MGALRRSGISGLHSSVSDRNYLEYVAESISDWTRAEELKREAARAQTTGPAEVPQGAKRSRLVLEKHEMEETRVSDLMFPDLQTQLEEEEPVIREGSLKVSTCSPP